MWTPPWSRRVEQRFPLLSVVGGAAVVAVATALLLQSLTQGRADRAGADAAGLAADHRVKGYTLATLYDVNDPAQVLNLPATEAPQTNLTVMPAADGGWELTLDVVNFAFVPATADGQHVPGQGRAHLYVDGEYVTDFLSPTQTLPPFAAGTHDIAVGLNTIDHRAYARDGQIVVERVVLRVGDPRRRPTIGEAKTFDVTVRGGRATTGDTIRVKQNELIRLRWTSDAPLTLHLEGYDVEAEVSQRSSASMLFVADLAGRFPVEQHGEEGAHGRAAVMYLEVYP